MKKLAIIILSFNGGQRLVDCFRSLLSIKVPLSWQTEVILVDNASVDDSLRKVKELKIKGLQFLQNKKNLGFAAGMNQGIKVALKRGAQAVLLLNQDTRVEKDFLISLLANPADLVAPLIKFKKDGRYFYDFGGRIDWWIGRTRHLNLLTRRLEQTPAIDYLTGCALLIRTPVFKKIGFLNEDYFLYFEDVDFCLRVQQAGFQISLEPKSMVEHQLIGPQRRPRGQNYQLLKSNLIFISRWLPWWQKPTAYLYWLFLCLKIFFK